MRDPVKDTLPDQDIIKPGFRLFNNRFDPAKQYILGYQVNQEYQSDKDQKDQEGSYKYCETLGHPKI